MSALRRLLPAVALCAALSAAPIIQVSRACPMVIPPQPLRKLYEMSDRVAVVRVGSTEILGRRDEEVLTRVTLHVTEDVKGDGPNVVHLSRSVWPAEEEEEEREAPAFVEGQRLLVFLDRGAEGYEIDDENYGAKPLSEEALKLYLKRIEELAALTAHGPIEKKALVEWLVRCAEQPATRWEGAYELELSAEAAAENESGEAEDGAADGDGDASETAGGAEGRAEAAASDGAAVSAGDGGRPVEAADGIGMPDPEQVTVMKPPAAAMLRARQRFTEPDAELVKLLNEDQRRRLADSLFAAEEMGEGEGALLRVVAHYGDSRLAPFVLAQLRRVEAEAPYVAEQWLGLLAVVLGDEEVGRLVAEYRQKAVYDVYSEQGADDGGAEQAAEESAAEEPDYEHDPEALRAAEKRITERRSALLRVLLDRLGANLAAAQLAAQ
ncbi:MAG TPA: hypothetical protein VEY09_02815 [Pyrinomonadaceae bacterium]|nr:hypothetical protein [Pyrinomonadaceae bacterium]